MTTTPTMKLTTTPTKFTPHAAAGAPVAAPPYTPTEDDQQEAEGLALTVLSMLDEPHLDELLDTLDGAAAQQQQDAPAPAAGKRAFSAAITAPRPGMQLVASRKNPRVRRWIKFAAAKDVGLNAVHTLAHINSTFGEAKEGGLISAAGHAADRLMSLRHDKRTARFTDPSQDATHPQHYLTHHADFVSEMSKRYGVGAGTVAHSLAYHGTVELERQKKNTDYAAKGNKTNPYHNPNTSDTDYHRHLGTRAKGKFLNSMIRLRKK